MTARSDLLESISRTVADYRRGEIEPRTPDHVALWVSQFPAGVQLPMLCELDHVLKRTYVSRQAIEGFFDSIITHPQMCGGDSLRFWSQACLLEIQRRGNSQADTLGLFARRLASLLGLEPRRSRGKTNQFVYLDDALFTGRRLTEDLGRWIKSAAPPSADVHIVVYASHSGGRWESKRALDAAARQAGKAIRLRYWVTCEYETRKASRDASGVLWPAQLPDDPVLNRYLDRPSRFPFVERHIGGALGPFSSESGRVLLEEQFSAIGARIRAGHVAPSPQMRPLGFGNYGLGVGTMVVTYRNCPNNAPLALWWSVNRWWTPLLPRRVNGVSSAMQQPHVDGHGPDGRDLDALAS